MKFIINSDAAHFYLIQDKHGNIKLEFWEEIEIERLCGYSNKKIYANSVTVNISKEDLNTIVRHMVENKTIDIEDITNNES